jgi:imidazolonepropionase-like amidohydrolase
VKQLHLVVFLLTGLFVTPDLLAQAQDVPLAFTNVTVIDVSDGVAHPGMTVVITGSRITAVGTVEEVGVPAGARVVDGTSRFLIPGFWDMHTHHSWRSFGLHIANGVTGVRDMGISTLSLVEIETLRQEVLAGREIGPRVVAAGPTVDGGASNDGALVSATTPERGRRVVDSLSAAGADFIKVYHLPRETFFAIADQAAERGIPIAGHLSPEVTLEEAAAAGQRSIEHYTRSHPRGLLPLCSSQPDQLSRAFEELRSLRLPPRDSVHLAHRRRMMRLAVDTYDEERCRSASRDLAGFETWHTPTLVMGMGYPGIHDPDMLRDPRLEYLPPSQRRRFESLREIYVSSLTEREVADFRRVIYRIVANLQRAGVGLLAGTDATGGFPIHGFGIHDELEELVSAGLTPAEALRTATVHPARYLGRTDELGTVEEGKLADLVLLEANPLKDIGNTRWISAVVANGRYFDRQELDTLLAQAEAAAGASREPGGASEAQPSRDDLEAAVRADRGAAQNRDGRTRP